MLDKTCLHRLTTTCSCHFSALHGSWSRQLLEVSEHSTHNTTLTIVKTSTLTRRHITTTAKHVYHFGYTFQVFYTLILTAQLAPRILNTTQAPKISCHWHLHISHSSARLLRLCRYSFVFILNRRWPRFQVSRPVEAWNVLQGCGSRAQFKNNSSIIALVITTSTQSNVQPTSR